MEDSKKPLLSQRYPAFIEAQMMKGHDSSGEASGLTDQEEELETFLAGLETFHMPKRSIDELTKLFYILYHQRMFMTPGPVRYNLLVEFEQDAVGLQAAIAIAEGLYNADVFLRK